jgi:UDP:flavonoid glycosyltransferase YjiC (YdhE family)
MRILFTFTGGRGHAEPLLPIALAATAAGHEIAMASAAEAVPHITAAGITAFATSEPLPPRPEGDRRPQAPDPDQAPAPADTPGPKADQIPEGYALRSAHRHASAIQDVVREWKPDLIVREEMDFGSAIAAEVLGLPCATVLVMAAGVYPPPDAVRDPLNALRAQHGLPADPELAMLTRDLVLSPFPPSFRSPEAPLPATAFSYRGADAVAARAGVRGEPTVYFTLGTVFTDDDLMARVIAGLGDVAARVVVTTGRKVDPAGFGPQPGHVRIERFIPQAELLPGCDLVVSHAGSGTLIGSLAHGVPSVLLPMGADQPDNARRCEELGVALVLDPESVTSEEISEAVRAVLADAGYRDAAERVRAEINALPGPEQTVALLESLVARWAP